MNEFILYGFTSDLCDSTLKSLQGEKILLQTHTKNPSGQEEKSNECGEVFSFAAVIVRCLEEVRGGPLKAFLSRTSFF